MLSTPLLTFPRCKTTHFQQIKFRNCRIFSFYSTNFKFNPKPRVFLKWTFSCIHDNMPRLASCIITIYLLSLTPEVNAQDHSPYLVRYACEDVKTYYSSIDHLKGKALSRKLNSIIAGHHSLSYKEVWDALKILDAADIDKPEASSGIVEIYSSRVAPKRLAGKLEGWNREHLWPHSYGLMRSPSLTDLHNIRPADANVNSSRGNKYFGECQVGLTHCMKPANKEAASDTETDMKIWAPPLRLEEMLHEQ
ncbi:uncharacterized protein LOC110692278 isoform X2 [Chenopodium quinoa]|uniref:uncharacterized protein LOC110692278 isoform X2 n=1 Tax=Chenopodium quinoa TaxID=63459 RepID=UPI000B79AD6A|nr:uncharacterized protein LOC110692278 isoform X2 [Chenopodium quinoa]